MTTPNPTGAGSPNRPARIELESGGAIVLTPTPPGGFTLALESRRGKNVSVTVLTGIEAAAISRALA